MQYTPNHKPYFIIVDWSGSAVRLKVAMCKSQEMAGHFLRHKCIGLVAHKKNLS